MAHVTRPAVVVVLLVLAGCGNPVLSSPSEQTPTAAPSTIESTTESTPTLEPATTTRGRTTDSAARTPRTATRTATPTATATATPERNYLPGVSERGFENATRLLESHTESLERSGALVRGIGNATIVANGILVDVTSTQANRMVAGGSPYRTRRLVDTGLVEKEWNSYGDGSTEYRRSRTNAEVSFSRHEPRSSRELAGRGLLLPYLQGGNYTLVRTESTDDGRLFTFRATTYENASALKRALPDGTTEVRSYRSNVTVDSDGRVHSLTAHVGYVIRGENKDHVIDFDLERTGIVSVKEPSWLPKAKNATSSG